MNNPQYSIPIKSIKSLLDGLFNNQAYVEIELDGNNFVYYLGEELPQEGNVTGINIKFSSVIDISDLRWMLKERRNV
jgi:hypothetical protein